MGMRERLRRPTRAGSTSAEAGAMTATATATELADKLLAAWNARDLAAFGELLADDVEWYDPAMAEPPARERAAVLAFSESVLRAFADFKYEVQAPVCSSADGSRCAIVWRIGSGSTSDRSSLASRG